MSVYKKMIGSTKLVKYNNTGIEQCEQGDFDKGIANFNQAIGQDPRVSIPYFNRSIAFNKVGLYLSARADYEVYRVLDTFY